MIQCLTVGCHLHSALRTSSEYCATRNFGNPQRESVIPLKRVLAIRYFRNQSALRELLECLLECCIGLASFQKWRTCSKLRPRTWPASMLLSTPFNPFQPLIHAVVHVLLRNIDRSIELLLQRQPTCVVKAADTGDESS